MPRVLRARPSIRMHPTPCRRVWLRAWLSSLLGLGLMLAPVLNSIAEVHELTHADVPHGDHGSPPAGSSRDGNDGSVLHQLAQATHCCSHVLAALPDTSPVLPLRREEDRAPLRRVHDSLSAETGSLFRPPIGI